MLTWYKEVLEVLPEILLGNAGEMCWNGSGCLISQCALDLEGDGIENNRIGRGKFVT